MSVYQWSFVWTISLLVSVLLVITEAQPSPKQQDFLPPLIVDEINGASKPAIVSSNPDSKETTTSASPLGDTSKAGSDAGPNGESFPYETRQPELEKRPSTTSESPQELEPKKDSSQPDKVDKEPQAASPTNPLSSDKDINILLANKDDAENDLAWGNPAAKPPADSAPTDREPVESPARPTHNIDADIESSSQSSQSSPVQPTTSQPETRSDDPKPTEASSVTTSAKPQVKDESPIVAESPSKSVDSEKQGFEISQDQNKPDKSVPEKSEPTKPNTSQEKEATNSTTKTATDDKQPSIISPKTEPSEDKINLDKPESTTKEPASNSPAVKELETGAEIKPASSTQSPNNKSPSIVPVIGTALGTAIGAAAVPAIVNKKDEKTTLTPKLATTPRPSVRPVSTTRRSYTDMWDRWTPSHRPDTRRRPTFLPSFKRRNRPQNRFPWSGGVEPYTPDSEFDSSDHESAGSRPGIRGHGPGESLDDSGFRRFKNGSRRRHNHDHTPFDFGSRRRTQHRHDEASDREEPQEPGYPRRPAFSPFASSFNSAFDALNPFSSWLDDDHLYSHDRPSFRPPIRPISPSGSGYGSRPGVGRPRPDFDEYDNRPGRDCEHEHGHGYGHGHGHGNGHGNGQGYGHGYDHDRPGYRPHRDRGASGSDRDSSSSSSSASSSSSSEHDGHGFRRSSKPRRRESQDTSSESRRLDATGRSGSGPIWPVRDTSIFSSLDSLFSNLNEDLFGLRTVGAERSRPYINRNGDSHAFDAVISSPKILMPPTIVETKPSRFDENEEVRVNQKGKLTVSSEYM